MATFSEKVRGFVCVNYDHVRLLNNFQGIPQLVFDADGYHGKAESPMDLIACFGLHVEEDSFAEFPGQKVYLLVDDEGSHDYVRLWEESEFWEACKEELRLAQDDEEFQKIMAC